MPSYRIKEHKFTFTAPITMNIPGTINTSGTLTLTPVTVNSVVTGDPARPVATLITGDPAKPVTTTVQGNPDKPVASTVDVLNLPKLSKQDIKDLLTPEIRAHIPNYQQICFNWLGMELFSICFSGETQVITEPYRPNAYERCELPCCEPDTRPFPERGREDYTDADGNRA